MQYRNFQNVLQTAQNIHVYVHAKSGLNQMQWWEEGGERGGMVERGRQGEVGEGGEWRGWKRGGRDGGEGGRSEKGEVIKECKCDRSHTCIYRSSVVYWVWVFFLLFLYD